MITITIIIQIKTPSSHSPINSVESIIGYFCISVLTTPMAGSYSFSIQNRSSYCRTMIHTYGRGREKEKSHQFNINANYGVDYI